MKKKNITITVNPKLYEIIDENFDNKSKLIEWSLIQILSMKEEYKKELEKLSLI